MSLALLGPDLTSLHLSLATKLDDIHHRRGLSTGHHSQACLPSIPEGVSVGFIQLHQPSFALVVFTLSNPRVT